MKILILHIMYAYIDKEVEEAFRREECDVTVWDCSECWTGMGNLYENPVLEKKASEAVTLKQFDAVYTSNYYPVISRICFDNKLTYLSWYYDTPPFMEAEEDLRYPTNRLFFFNRDDALAYQTRGIRNVYYLPLAVNTARWQQVIESGKKDYSAEVSLVGRLYRSQYPAMRDLFSAYYKGWLDGIVAAQQQLYGAYVIEQLLTEGAVSELKKEYAAAMEGSGKLNERNLSFSICSHIAYLERLSLLQLMGKRFDTVFYTDMKKEERSLLPSVRIHDPVSYEEVMPLVFSDSKINLCPILRNNQNGIPLRALDVMGCGGFLMASFQQGLAENFEDGKELVFYHSLEEAVDLTGYFLTHEKERKDIAQNGFQRVEAEYRYESRIRMMLEKV